MNYVNGVVVHAAHMCKYTYENYYFIDSCVALVCVCVSFCMWIASREGRRQRRVCRGAGGREKGRAKER